MQIVFIIIVLSLAAIAIALLVSRSKRQPQQTQPTASTPTPSSTEIASPIEMLNKQIMAGLETETKLSIQDLVEASIELSNTRRSHQAFKKRQETAKLHKEIESG